MSSQKKSVIVIGGGLGGISAAISLAQSGYNVSLFEQNDHLGGKLNRLEQDGFGFDLGPSILTMPHVFEKLFTDSGRKMDDYLSIIQLDQQWRSFFPDGSVIDLYGDLEKMSRENKALSEKDMNEYKEFLSYAKKLYDATEKGYFEKGLDKTGEIFRVHGLIGAMKDFDYISSMYDAIEKRISNQKVRDM
ncbi:MAG: FAD-dependent oxidoreductase, partial [Carnobacterium jeotgali]|uniref:phytoene desaturase family protein n=1 Tax=Carnobacterium jeotgali TaxID=545534 RepID=UPI003C75589C